MRGGNGGRESRSPYLPSGYRLDEEADFAVLRREDGSEVAVFGERVVTGEVQRVAWEDRRGATTGSGGAAEVVGARA